jgi:hypothetical protein
MQNEVREGGREGTYLWLLGKSVVEVAEEDGHVVLQVGIEFFGVVR